MKITPEENIDYIYIEMLKQISKITGNSIDDTLKTAIACLHNDWAEKKLL